MTTQQINAALQADPQFQDLLQKAADSRAAANGHSGGTFDPNAASAVQNYADQFSKAHGYDPGMSGSGTGDRTNLYSDGQYHTQHDASGWQNGLVPALAPLIAGTAGIAGGAILGGAGAEAAGGGAPEFGIEVGNGALGTSGAEGALGGITSSSIPGGTAASAAASAPVAGTSGLGTLGKLSSVLDTAGHGIGGAAQAAGNNALDQEKLALQANKDNIAGTTAYENALINRAHEEDDQRSTALRNVYRNSYATNPAASTSPFNTRPTQYSPQYLQTLADLANQGSTKLATKGQYDTNGLPELQPYKAIDPKDVQGATNTKPGTLQTVGNWLSPTLSVAGKVLDWLK